MVSGSKHACISFIYVNACLFQVLTKKGYQILHRVHIKRRNFTKTFCGSIITLKKVFNLQLLVKHALFRAFEGILYIFGLGIYSGAGKLVLVKNRGIVGAKKR